MAQKVSSSSLHPPGDTNSHHQGRFHVERSEDSDGVDEESNNNQQTWMPHSHLKTREALVDEKYYHDSVNGEARPGLDTIRNNTFQQKAGNVAAEDGPVLKGKVIKFGWLEGVLMRCLLNIWGVMLFLRLSWLVGQSGVWQGFCIITTANAVTFITAFSMSAVSTNGKIKGGGIYYMISRSLGPEFGAAIGLMFTLANSIAVALYIVGFCESLNDLLKVNNWGEIVDGGINDIRIVGIGVLICILILAFVGMDWVTRTQMILLFILIAAQVDYVVGTIIGPVSDQEKAQGFTGFSTDTWNENFGPDYRVDRQGSGNEQSFFSVFGVFFPAVTGIVAGANLSGDLKDPASAIPKGTLLAILITYLSYIGYALMMGGSVLREATGDLDQYLEGLNITMEEANQTGFKFYTDCMNGTDYICDYGLLNNPQVMGLASSWDPLIYMGCFAATLSSAIASLVGAPRVLQALAKDKLYPLIEFFAKGYGANNDPVRGYLLVFLISLGCILIGTINDIAPLLSNFFLAAYCLINFSVFHAEISKSPGWRPSFRYYNAWVSLLGSLLCIAVMFLMNWVTAIVTVGLSVFLYMYVSYRKPDVNWGSSTQAQAYNSALGSVQTLNTVEEHVKNYRPQILILSGMPSSRPALIDFSHLLVKNHSLVICGHVVNEHLNHKARNQLTRQTYNWLSKRNKKSFYTLVEDTGFSGGAHSIMQASGLGKLRPNLVMLGYKNNWKSASGEDVKEYINVVQDAFNLHFAVSILRVPGGLDYSHILQGEGNMTAEQIAELTQQTTHATSKFPMMSQISQDSEDISSDEASTHSSIPTIEVTAEDDKGNGKNKPSNQATIIGKSDESVPHDVLTRVDQFTQKQQKGTIDVWWLYDDGGLTILLPYLLTMRSQFSECQLRIFTLTSRLDELGSTQINMASLLSKFRIDYSDVIVIPDITSKAKEETKVEFEAMIKPFVNDDVTDGTAISSADIVTHREKTNRHLRLHELLLAHSKNSTFVVMTLPVPRKGHISAPLYMAWLEMITKDMPPFLLVRGNQTSVLTFYS
ncbi:unnamed protein product [Allacma fusca]|uniref:Uncharacterized protein n=1 Tax=Allacma fusca TaxID=39272 RepID=A0A8J2LAP5_9HEXA|nr:unnamed protein product [Allacma fusca]